MPKKIAFIKVRSFSFINPKLIEQMERTFGEYEIEVFDLKDWLVAHKPLLVMAYLAAWKEYGREIIMRKKKATECLFTTEFMFAKIRQAIAARINADEYVFTFQTQSLFDASVSDLPHFMYTDYTVRAFLSETGSTAPYQLFSPAWLRHEPAIYRHPTKIFAASNAARDSMIADYGCDPDQVTTVYTGVNVAVEPPADKTYDEPQIVFVGVEWERKGGPDVIAAFRKVLDVCPTAKLTIVGCSPQVDLPNVTVVGRVPKEQVSQYLRAATIFCMPSRIEPAGIAFTEAAMYKLPIVSARAGGIPDRVIHGETGYLVAVGDRDMLATYLIELVQNPDLCRQFGEAGAELARSFTWEHVGTVIHKEIMPHLNA